jgi:hypothetical protein
MRIKRCPCQTNGPVTGRRAPEERTPTLPFNGGGVLCGVRAVWGCSWGSSGSWGSWGSWGSVALASVCGLARLRLAAIPLAIALPLMGTGCATADLRPAPDASVDPELGTIATAQCPDAAFDLCDASPALREGCNGEPDRPGSDPAAIPAERHYPLGCVVNIPSPYKTPQGECLVAASCRCVAPGAQATDGGSQWSCLR